MDLPEFNAAPPARVAELLLQCLDVQRWVDELVELRPFPSMGDLIRSAARAAGQLSPAEIEQALSHHPRIGERAAGRSVEATFSRSEQSLVRTDAAVTDALREGNAAYEARFGRVFLIRAAGRSAEEILEQLRSRLHNAPDAEEVVVGRELKEIAVRRLEQLVEGVA